MGGDLIAGRERALARHDKALERWPDRSGAGFAAEIAGAVDELEKVAAALDTQRASAIERCRTLRYVGDALFDLARGTDIDTLKRAAAAYGRAETLIEGLDEPLDRAKLDFNFANILRGMSGGRDRALLEEALLRYQMALGTFMRQTPQYAATVQGTLDTLLPQLKLLDTLDRVCAGHESATKAADALARSPNDPANQRRARDLLAKLHKRRSGLLTDAIEAVQDFSPQAARGARRPTERNDQPTPVR